MEKFSLESKFGLYNYQRESLLAIFIIVEKLNEKK